MRLRGIFRGILTAPKNFLPGIQASPWTGLGRIALGGMAICIAAPAVALASPASDFVNDFGDQIVQILNAPVPLTDKRREILPLLNKNVAIEEIGKYCLGRYWRVATPEQQTTYLKLFHQVLLNAVTAQIGNYQNVSFRVTGSIEAPGGNKVTAIISRPNQPPVTMTVVIDGNPPKVVDLYGEGASLRLTQRQDYVSFLSRHNGDVQTLIQALDAQVQRNEKAGGV